jgi:hypothetical protein
MDELRSAPAHEETAPTSEGLAPASPGKATLTQQLRRGPSIDAIAERVIQRLAGGTTPPPTPPKAPVVQRAPAAATPVPETSCLIAHDVAARGTSGTGGALPHLQLIQESFGRHDVSGVSAHVGGAAAEASTALGARAYAFGNDVAFGDTPDLHTAAHEAAHVVQQRGGVQLEGGIGEDGDPHERHADAVADAVVRGDSAEGLLDTYAPAGGAPSVQRRIQRLHAEGATATSTLLFRLGNARDSQLDIIAGLLVDQLTAGGTEPFSMQVELGAERLDLVDIPHRDIVRLSEAVADQRDETARRAHAAGAAGATHEVHVGAIADLTNILDTVIAAAGGLEGDGADLQMIAHIPFEVCAVVLALHLQIEHGEEGYRVVAEPRVGLGTPSAPAPGPDSEHADALAGYRIEAQGHDSHMAAQLVVNGVEHSLNSLLAIVGGVTTDDAERSGREGMTESDFVDTSLGIAARGEATSAATADDPATSFEGEVGVAQHWRAEGEDGAEEMAYQSFDFHTRDTIHGCGIEVEAHAVLRTGTLLPGEHAPDMFKVKFFGTTHADGMATWMGSMLFTCLDLMIQAGEAAEAHGIVTAARAAQNRANIAGALGADAVAAGAHHGAHVGIGVELTGGTHSPTVLAIHLETESELHVGVFDTTFEHTHEIFRHEVE